MEMEDSFASKVPSFAEKDKKQKPQLTEQNLKTLDVTTLTPLSQQVISRQATINIGTIGHVAHGKSTVVKAISGVKTIRFKTEMVRNITIKLGYANAKIFKCGNPACPRPSCYAAYSSYTEDHPPCQREGCGGKMDLLRHVSFVDCFGLNTEFMKSDFTTVLNSNLKVGDKLLGVDGTPRTVKSIKEGEKDMYRVAFNGNSPNPEFFDCTGGHLLCLRFDRPFETPSKDERGYYIRYMEGDENQLKFNKVYFKNQKQAKKVYKDNLKTTKPVVAEITVESFLALPNSVQQRARLYRAPPMEFSNKDRITLSIGEATEEEVGWVIGYWLGDGDAVEARFTAHKSDDEENIQKLSLIAQKMGLFAVVSEYKDRNAKWITLSTKSGPARNMNEKSNVNSLNPFYLLLKKLNLLRNKHIPNEILFHSISVRESVAAGIIDSDGGYSKGQFDLEQSAETHSELFNGFVTLIRSIGYIARISERITQLGEKSFKKYRVRFNGTNVSNMPIARADKKGRDFVRFDATSQPFIVTKRGKDKYRGFEVDGDGKVLLKNFIVVHNCPGHDILMATMLNGAAVMDAALLLIAGNEPCPQPQTSEHLAAVEIMKLKHIIILQNKIDLVKESQATAQHEDILRFIQGTVADGSPIIPISAQLKYNIDVVCEYIVKKIPVPTRDFLSSPRLIVIRSFDVNKPGEEVDDLKGGVAGGSIVQGVLKLDQEIEVRPGIVSKNPDGSIKCTPIFSRIISLYAEENELQYAVPGGLIGVGTLVDPTLTRADRLVGQVLGEVGKLPEIYTELEISFFLLRRLLGVKTEGDKQGKVAKLQKGEILMVNIGSTSTGGRIVAVKADLAKVVLTSPVCTQVGEKLALSRRVDKHWRLIGWGSIKRGIFIATAEK